MPPAQPVIHVRGDATINWLTVDNALSSSEGELTAEHDSLGHHRFIPLMFHGGALSDAAFIGSMLQTRGTPFEAFDGNAAVAGGHPLCQPRLRLRAELALSSGARLECFDGRATFVDLAPPREFAFQQATLDSTGPDAVLSLKFPPGAPDARQALCMAAAGNSKTLMLTCERCICSDGAGQAAGLQLTIDKVNSLGNSQRPADSRFGFCTPAEGAPAPQTISGEEGRVVGTIAGIVLEKQSAPATPEQIAAAPRFAAVELACQALRVETAQPARFSADCKSSQCSNAVVQTYALGHQHYHPLNRHVPHSIWTFRVYPRDAKNPGKATVFRLHSVNGYNNIGASVWHALPFSLEAAEEAGAASAEGASEPHGPRARRPDVLVLRDMDLGFRGHCDEAEAARRLGIDRNAQHTWPQAVVINLKEPLPKEEEMEAGVWRLLCGELASRTIVVMSMDLFNPTQVDLARDRSLERTACDFLAGWLRSRVARALMKCRGLVIRLRSSAAMWIRNHGQDASLFFVPHWEEPERTEYGRMSGKNAVFVGAFVRQIVEQLTEPPGVGGGLDLSAAAPAAIKLALHIQPSMHRAGYGARWPSQDSLNARGLFHDCSFGRMAGAASTTEIAEYLIPHHRNDGARRRWSILQEACGGEGPGRSYSSVAHDIVRHGVSSVFGAPNHRSALDDSRQVRTPVVQFGKLVVVDRLGIERCRELRMRLQAYQVSQVNKPLSIAVFGRPGAGKSFFVQQIARNSGFPSVEVLTFNLTQFHSESDIEAALLRVRNINLDNRLPVVFFDEFDGPRGQMDLGWLRSFISPMEDGTFDHAGQTLHVGRALFVFAGGVYHSNIEFRAAAHPMSAASRHNKAPDFDSRLADRFDVWSINRQGNEDDEFLIRRALVLRGLLEDRRLCGYQHRARISEGVLTALLDPKTVFKHELRSLRMLIDASISPQGRVDQSSLPTAEQLDQFVESGERFRASMP